MKAVQKTGETTRDMWHKTDWNKVREDPSSIAMPREDWIHFHDAEAHAEEAFDEIFEKYAIGDSQVNGNEQPFVGHAKTVPSVIKT